MIQKGSQRVGAARTGALSDPSCTCMKTTTQSGQAWRGYERAERTLCAKTDIITGHVYSIVLLLINPRVFGDVSIKWLQ